jgi:hypothetical protein
MLCYRLNNLVLFHLNAQKGYVSLYCGDSKKIDPDGIFLTGLNIGKGCIRFSKSKDVSKTAIEDFIKQTIVLSKECHNLDC